MRYLPLLALLAGCLEGIDPSWQLDHDRLVVVRASSPHIAPGEMTTFDALVAHKGGPTDVETPLGVLAYGPKDLSSVVSGDSVVCPDAATLDAERGELGLDPGTPVPLDLVMEFPDSNGIHLLAKKTIYLGDSVMNPASVGDVTIDGAPPDPTQIVIASGVDVPLASDAAPDAMVNWLTSCGTMHDDDEHAAFIHVQPGDRKDGELAVVIRDALGGVAWQVWPISAQ
jgi:hypothetical protein